MASGQHNTKRIKKRANAINVFILVGWISLFSFRKTLARSEFGLNTEKSNGGGLKISFQYSKVTKNVHFQLI